MKTKAISLQMFQALAVFSIERTVAQAQTENTSNIVYTINSSYNSTYHFNTYTITINAYNIINPAVIIPSTINGIPVTSIGNYATTSIGASITIPDSVTNIGEGAFTSQTELTNVMIGSGISYIGDAAFTHCPALTGVYFMGNAPSIGTNLFMSDDHVAIYYLPFTKGWSNTFAGRPALPWNPPTPDLGITTYSNQPVLFFPIPQATGTNYVLQMTTNLASGNWSAVTNGVPIIGLQITNITGPAFFRIR
jgi:hypothetical protein